MPSGFAIRKNQYYDSVFLMGVNKRLADAPGVNQTAVLMGSEMNKALLSEIGVRDPQIDAAQPNDLIIAVVAESAHVVEEVLGKLDEALNVMGKGATISALHTLEDGLVQKPEANLAVISIPGEYAGREARKALEAGMNVFLFSSNVSIEDELHLKRYAAENNLLVMGPDCGTSLINGVGIGFANVVRRGAIGVIGAAGTGLQEFTSQIHNAGKGISHAIGTGSRDVSDEIGGISTFSALKALERDPQTEIIAFISKPPGEKTFEQIIQHLEHCTKPTVGCFLGTRMETSLSDADHLYVTTIDEAVQWCIQRSAPTHFQLSPEERDIALREKSQWSGEHKYLRGLFAGGTFCYQGQQILLDAGISVHSNAPLHAKSRLLNPEQSLEHTLVDMGDEIYTLGKPHPMIDGTVRKRRIQAESRDPTVGILLLDFILGYNASMDPVGELFDTIVEAREVAKRRGGHLTVVASLCGTDSDPQDYRLQEKMLREAGAVVFHSNARAVGFCCELLRRS